MIILIFEAGIGTGMAGNPMGLILSSNGLFGGLPSLCSRVFLSVPGWVEVFGHPHFSIQQLPASVHVGHLSQQRGKFGATNSLLCIRFRVVSASGRRGRDVVGRGAGYVRVVLTLSRFTSMLPWDYDWLCVWSRALFVWPVGHLGMCGAIRLHFSMANA